MGALEGRGGQPQQVVDRTRGFTLLELLLTLSVLGLVLGILGTSFTVSLQGWEATEAELAVHATGHDIANALATGLLYHPGLEYGIEDALTVVRGEASELDLLPPWQVSILLSPDRPLPLDPPHQPGAPPPLLLTASDPRILDAHVTDNGTRLRLLEPVAEGTSAELHYRPVLVTDDPLLRFRFDAAEGRLTREYAGQVTRFPLHGRGVELVSLAFSYYTDQAPGIPVSRDPRDGGIVRAVGVEFTLRKRDVTHTFTRVVPLRSAGQGQLVTRTSGRRFLLPSPDRIRQFEFRYLAGAQPEGRVRLEAGTWRAEMRFLTQETVEIVQTLDNRMESRTIAHLRHAVPFLNPDILLYDGAREGAGDAGRPARLRHGSTLSPLPASTRLRYLDHDGSGFYARWKTLFLDRNGNDRFDPEDLLLSGFGDDPDAEVRELRVEDRERLRFHDRRQSGTFDPGDALVLDMDGNGIFGGAFYDGQEQADPIPLRITVFDADGATLLIR